MWSKIKTDFSCPVFEGLAACLDGFDCAGTGGGGTCITDKTLMCDGYNSCGPTDKYADEIGCGTNDGCLATQFKCRTTTPVKCVDAAKLCDGVNDCGDYSDEGNC